MSDARPASYQATYRRSEAALPALLGVLLFMAGGLYLAIRFGNRNDLMSFIIAIFAATFIALIAILIGAFRVHQWTIVPRGVEIHERPRLPRTGIPRRATIAFAEIAEFARIESGFDRLVQIRVRDGRQFRLPQKMNADPRGFGTPDELLDLSAFAEAIRAAAQRSGHILPPTSEGLSFWNRPFGIGILTILFLLTIPIAAAVGWALFDGGLPVQPRGGQSSAILLLLPFGAAYALNKAIRRRRRVLAAIGRAANLEH